MMSEYPVFKKISPHVYLIRGENKSRFPEANSVLIDDEILTLVDAGSNLSHIEQTLRSLQHQIEDIEQIVLTHFHIDHKGYAQQILERADCEVMCHPAGKEAVETFEGMMRYYGVENHQYRSYWENILEEWLPHVKSSYKITDYLKEGREIDCGETSLVPIHTPGHTPDHTCIGINGTETILLVDIDLTRFGPWYGNKVSVIDEFKESVRKVINLQPKIGISSHLLNPVEDALQERLEEFYTVFNQREKRIIENIKNGLDTVGKLSKAPTIYPRIPLDLFLIFEEFMVRKHVDQLKSKGIIRQEEEKLMIERK
ncbi:MAG: Hydroxyacylglutathione hydrolase [Candidatus Thorarchaeota archaeon]|nr:MAG: Hydroxyacylglutathione hydrolase [Candidatus Thorarchaeota archaeon]